MTSDAPFRGRAVASCGWTPPGSPTKPPDPNPCCSFWREAGRWVEIKHGAEGGKHWAPAFLSCKQGWEDAYPATLTLQLPQKMNQSVLGSSEFTGQFSLVPQKKIAGKHAISLFTTRWRTAPRTWKGRLTSSVTSWPRSRGFSSGNRSSCSPAMVTSWSRSPRKKGA